MEAEHALYSSKCSSVRDSVTGRVALRRIGILCGDVCDWRYCFRKLVTTTLYNAITHSLVCPVGGGSQGPGTCRRADGRTCATCCRQPPSSWETHARRHTKRASWAAVLKPSQIPRHVPSKQRLSGGASMCTYRRTGGPVPVPMFRGSCRAYLRARDPRREVGVHIAALAVLKYMDTTLGQGGVQQSRPTSMFHLR